MYTRGNNVNNANIVIQKYSFGVAFRSIRRSNFLDLERLRIIFTCYFSLNIRMETRARKNVIMNKTTAIAAA
jgi:hypothetical protein